MSARESLERFSTAMLREETVFSLQEKRLLTQLLRKVSRQPDAEQARAAITRALGEMVLERASLALGESVAQQLLGNSATVSTPPMTGPRPPSPNPPGPGQDEPMSPRPPSPNPPRSGRTWREQSACTTAPTAPSEWVTLDEFLAPPELSALTQYTLDREMEFSLSEVVSPGVPGGSVDFEHRRSRVLMDLGPHREVILRRLEACWPQVLKRLGRDPFPISRVEAQITASNDGDFFRWHTDNGQNEVASREITFVYFFHREPEALPRR